MDNLEKKSVGQIVAEDYRAAKVFEHHKIDFCCSGGRSLDEVVREKGLDTEKIIEEIKQAKAGSEAAVDFESWPLDLLADYIVKTHHRFSEKQISLLKPYLEKVCRVHGDRHPELLEIQRVFNEIAGEIAAHTKKEEIMVFPFIKRLAEAKAHQRPYEKPRGKSVEDPVNMLRHEHDNQGAAFRKIAAISNDYTPPEDACNTYRVTFGLLEELEQDLHKHIHLENNILFPKALEMERELTA